MPNPFVHIEIRTRDMAKSKAFYQKVFDWQGREEQGYGLIDAGSPPGGGFFQAAPEGPPGVPRAGRTTAAPPRGAGGETPRMGAPKPLLEWGGYTLIEYQLAQLKRSPVDQVVVVLGHRADEIRPLVHRAGALAVINELYAEGRASSVRVGAAALGGGRGAVPLR